MGAGSECSGFPRRSRVELGSTPYCLQETEENMGVGEEGLLLQHHLWGGGWLVLAQQLSEGAQLLWNLWAKQVFVAVVIQGCPKGGEPPPAPPSHTHTHIFPSTSLFTVTHAPPPMLTNPISALHSKAKNRPSHLIWLAASVLVGGTSAPTQSAPPRQPQSLLGTAVKG